MLRVLIQKHPDTPRNGVLMIRILLAVSSFKLAFDLQTYLEVDPNFKVIGYVSEKLKLSNTAPALHPDLLILDDRLPPPICDLIHKLHVDFPHLKVVLLLSTHADQFKQ